MEAAINLRERHDGHDVSMCAEGYSVAVTGDSPLGDRVSRALLEGGYGAQRNLDAHGSTDAVVICCGGSPVLGVPSHAKSCPTVVVGHERGPCRSCGSALDSFADAWVPEQFLEVMLPVVLGGIIRRAKRPATLPKRVRLEREASKVWIDSTGIKMRRMPFEVMAYLVQQRGEWVKQETLLREVFGARRTYDTALVRVHVHALRRALGDLAVHVESQRGRGYRCSPSLFQD